jgi:hypothetical protein
MDAIGYISSESSHLDIVQFPSVVTYIINNIALFKEIDDYYYFEESVTHNVDFITDVRITEGDVKIAFIFGGIEISQPSNARPLLMANSQYTDIKLRYYFKKNNIPPKITLSYKCHLMKQHLRRNMINTPICTDGVEYDNGICQVIGSSRI